MHKTAAILILRAWVVVIVGASPIALCTACGGGSVSDTATGSTGSFDDDTPMLVERLQEIECERLQRCLAPMVASGLVSTTDVRAGQCKQQTEPGLRGALIEPLRQGITAGRIAYHGEQLEACLEAEEARSCPQLSAHPDACLQAFEGKVPVGEPCAISYDCEGDAFCDNEQMSLDEPDRCPALCRARAPEGADCERQIECERGLRCRDPNTTTQRKCLPPATEGENCHGLHCTEDLVCSPGPNIGNVSPESLLSCRPFESGAAEGQPCSPLQHCRSDLACRPNETGDFVCTAATAGMPCDSGRECGLDMVCACQTSTDCMETVCQPWPTEGQACGARQPGISYICAVGLRCHSDGRCGNGYADEGEACESSNDCRAGHCQSGRCLPLGVCDEPPSEGSLASSCHDDQDCDEGMFCAAGGPLQGLCTRECDDDAICVARFGDDSFCLDDTLCARHCDGAIDCPGGVQCDQGLCVSM